MLKNDEVPASICCLSHWVQSGAASGAFSLLSSKKCVRVARWMEKAAGTREGGAGKGGKTYPSQRSRPEVGVGSQPSGREPDRRAPIPERGDHGRG